MMAAREKGSGGLVVRNEPMSRHTSWRVGGPAEIYYRPGSENELAEFLAAVDPATPIFWFGLGSNLLVRDGGLDGVVVATAGAFGQLERLQDDTVVAGASVPCTRLARQCIRWGLGPSEFFAGIPGSVGGALAMNAGAHGGETWDRVRTVRTIDRTGSIRTRTPGEFAVGYRHVEKPADEWFLEARFAFEPDADPSMERMQAMLERRRDTQPLGLPSCGSVFRNPPGDFAARLIEAAGLKGSRIGDAEVSEKHANFIINRGEASASDIENLINYIRQTVADDFGVDLIPEVRIVGKELP